MLVCLIFNLFLLVALLWPLSSYVECFFNKVVVLSTSLWYSSWCFSFVFLVWDSLGWMIVDVRQLFFFWNRSLMAWLISVVSSPNGWRLKFGGRVVFVGHEDPLFFAKSVGDYLLRSMSRRRT